MFLTRLGEDSKMINEDEQNEDNPNPLNENISNGWNSIESCN